MSDQQPGAQSDSATQDVRIAAEGALPQRMTQHGDGRACRPTVVVSKQRSPPLGARTEHREISARHGRRFDNQPFVLDDDARSCGGPRRRRDIRHGGPNGLERQKSRRRREPLLARGAGGFKGNGEDSVRVDDVRRRAQECAIDQPGHRKIDPDRERSRQNDGDRDRRRGSQATDSRQEIDDRAVRHVSRGC